MSYPEEVKIALYGHPADIVGAFAGSYLGMVNIDNRYKTKYQYIDIKESVVPIRAKIMNFNALPFEEEEYTMFLDDFAGHIMVFRTQKKEIFQSEFIKEVKRRRIPFFAIGIDSSYSQMSPLISDAEEENFDLRLLFRWLISKAYDYQKTKRFTGKGKICLISHQKFVEEAPIFYKVIKDQEQVRRKIESYLREIGVVEGEFKALPNPNQIEKLFKENLDRFTYIKLADVIDKLKGLSGRYERGELSKEHYLALSNHQIKKIIDLLLKYL